jgi:hypothetical protein
VRLTHGASFILFALVVTFRTVAAGDWPENYIAHEHSESPDGHYGILVLSQQAAIDQDETDGNITYLANLQTRKTLGEIRETDYFENQNHRNLQVVWAPDSSMCVLQYDGRYGFESVFVLELKGESFRQIDIGNHIQKNTRPFVRRIHQCVLSVRARPQLKVRALSLTNPKGFPDQPSNYGVFQGTFDLKTGKWTQASAKKLTITMRSKLHTRTTSPST